MEAAMVEVPASEARERLFAFVEEVGRRLPQSVSAKTRWCTCAGWSSMAAARVCSRRCFGSAETPARYESVQQFLADSPWDPGLLVRACAERVAPQIGVLAWIVDDTGIAKDGTHSPGVKRQYSGTLGKIGNCQVDGVAARGRRARHGAARLGAVPARGVVRRLRGGGGRRRSPRRSSSRRSRSSRRRCVEQAAGWEIPHGADPGRLRLRRRQRLPHEAARARARVRARGLGAKRRLRPGDDLRGARAQRDGRAAARSVARPDRKPESVRVLAERLPAGALEDASLPHDPGRRRRLGRFAFVRVVATHPVTKRLPAAALGVADHRVARRRGGPERLLALEPAPRTAARAARPARAAALDDRARLPPTQGRARARPLRRPQLSRLPPPLRARHLRARLPHPRTARPKARRPA